MPILYLKLENALMNPLQVTSNVRMNLKLIDGLKRKRFILELFKIRLILEVMKKVQ